jgi:hypothetical protein
MQDLDLQAVSQRMNLIATELQEEVRQTGSCALSVQAGRVCYVGVVSQPIDIVQSSLPEPELLILDVMEQIERDILFRVRSRGRPRCPSCSGSEVSYHSTYVRRLRDLPWQGQPVQVQVKTRRLRCRNRHCPRKIFCGAIARRRGNCGVFSIDANGSVINT